MKERAISREADMEPNTPQSNQWMILFSVGLGLFMVVIDITILNIAMPTLAGSMNASLEEIEWTLIAYTVVLTGLVPFFGRVSDLVGRKRLFISGLLIFAVASLLAALSPSILWLIAARLLQAVGGAQITSNTLAIVTDIFPVGKRGVAMGIQSIIISGGAAIGPTLGGFLVTHFGWQAVFYVNVPIGIVGALIAAVVLPPLQSHSTAEPIDWMGAVTLIGGMSALLLGLTKGPSWGWFSFSVDLLILGGLGILSLFIAHELRTRFPLVDLSLFRIREFAAAQMAGLFATLAFASLFFLLPFYWQGLRGYSAQETGLLMLPVPLILMIVAPLSGKASDRLGSRGLATTGMLLIMAGLLMVSQLTETMSVEEVLGRLLVFGVGFGLFIAPNNNSVMSSVPPHQRGVAGGLLGMFRYLGQALGVAFAGALFAFLVADASGDGMNLLSSLSSGDSLTSDALSESHTAFIRGMRGVTLAGALFAGIGAVLSLLRGRSPSTGEIPSRSV
ncbi:MAG: MFS transporter [Deltaproteobacteria bacterium]|nr:MFS transporter [Deltaproteobacteria bacterium]